MKKGFTLVELLVVISIMGILMSLTLLGIKGARESSRDAKRKADLELIRSGLEIYKSDCNSYPEDITPGSNLVGLGDPTTCVEDNTYISLIPDDPLSPDRTYTYTRLTTSTYTLCAQLEGDDSTDYCVSNP